MAQDTEIPIAAFNIEQSMAHLLHRIGQKAGEAHHSEFGKQGLSARQFIVLSALNNLPNISQADLVEVTKIDRSTLAEIVRRLEDKNLIIRVRSKTDARENVLCLSDLGKTQYVDALPRAVKVDDDLLASLSDKNKSKLIGLIVQMLGEKPAEHVQFSQEKPPKPKKAKKAKKSKKVKP